MDQIAKKSNWLILKKNEAYEKTINDISSIYILKDGKKWSVWRGYWIYDYQKPIKETIIIKNVAFEKALFRANNYINWIKKREV